MKKKRNLRLNLLPVSKYSQVTVFVILALAITLVIILIIIKKYDLILIQQPTTPIESMKQCFTESLEDSINLLSSQGGSRYPELYFLYNNTKVEYLCYSADYYEKCIMQKPILKNSFEEELKRDLEKKIKECFEIQKASLERKGYQVSYRTPRIEIELVPKNILLNIEADLKISKEKTESYKNIKIVKTSKMYELIMITSSILNWEARFGESEIMNYMMYYPELKVEKKKQEDGTNVYILTDKETKEQFVFAARSIALPVGVTGR